MRKKVELNYGMLFRAMDEIIGHDRRLADISRDDCKAVRDLLLSLRDRPVKALWRDGCFAGYAQA